MEYDANAVGIVIQEVRRKRSLSQTVLADLSVVSRSHLSDIENGRQSPNIATLWRIADALGIRTSELIRRVEERI